MTTVWQKTLGYANSGASGMSIRNAHVGIPGGEYTQVRLRLSSHPTLTGKVDAASIGVASSNYNMSAGPWPVTFGGLPGITLTAGSPAIWSDWVSLPVPVTNPSALISVLDFSSTDWAHQDAISGADGFSYKVGTSAALANVSGFTHVAGRAVTVDQIDAVYALGTYTEFEVVGSTGIVDLPLPQGFRRWEIFGENVVSDIETATPPATGAVLTMYLGYGSPPTFYERSPHYMSAGFGSWQVEDITGFFSPQDLDIGLRLGIDTGDFAKYGLCFKAGLLGGRTKPDSTATHSTYRADFYKGIRGGVAGYGGYFTATPSYAGTPFNWCDVGGYSGHFDGRPGECPSWVRFRMDGATLRGLNIVGGYFRAVGVY